ncbi:hypothetical protein, partial [Scytonema sp. NUACC21]
EYSRNLFNLRSDILKFNALFFIIAYTMPLHLCYYNTNKEVIKSVESDKGQTIPNNRAARNASQIIWLCKVVLELCP